MWPIFVPSKGRVGVGRLLPLLAFERLKVTVVVEPQERGAYAASYPFHQLLVLPKNDQGLPYARQFLLDHARRKKLGWYWMLDDDVTGFYETAQGKTQRVLASTALSGAQALRQQRDRQVSLEYQQFAWRAVQPAVRNGYCDVVVAIDPSLAIDFDPANVLKVDRDYTMQVIAAGMDTLRVTRFSFSAPKNGSNRGGLFEMYARQGWERMEVAKLKEKWPWCVEHQTKSDGREDAKIAWKKIRREAS
jgi:hypothetical protein